MRERYPRILRKYCSECLASSNFVRDGETAFYICAGDVKERREGCGHKLELRDDDSQRRVRQTEG